MNHLQSLQMLKPWQRISFMVSTWIISLSGVIYIYMKYMYTPNQTAFTVLNHPWQKVMLKVHIVIAPIWIFLLGTLVINHVIVYYRARKKPGLKTGVLNVILALPMVLTAYVISLPTSPFAIEILAYAHLIIGCLFILAFGWHQLATKSRHKRFLFYFTIASLILYLFSRSA